MLGGVGGLAEEEEEEGLEGNSSLGEEEGGLDSSLCLGWVEEEEEYSSLCLGQEEEEEEVEEGLVVGWVEVWVFLLPITPLRLPSRRTCRLEEEEEEEEGSWVPLLLLLVEG